MAEKRDPGVGRPSGIKATSEYFGEVKAEFFRIAWTSKEELKVYTKIVVIATFFLGLGIYGADLVMGTVLSGLKTIVRMIMG